VNNSSTERIDNIGIVRQHRYYIAVNKAGDLHRAGDG
jgi:hypothetical protein